MLLRTLACFILAILIAGCGADEDRVVPPTPSASPSESVVPEAPPQVDPPAPDDDQRRALNTAQDTLEVLVATLETIQDPISAWNQAGDIARLLDELERMRVDLDLDMEEAAQYYPEEVARIKQLETQRATEMNRIMEDRVIAQVLLEEMSEAERAAEAAN